MANVEDLPIISLPESDPFPEILNVEQSSNGFPKSQNEEEAIGEEDDSTFSTFPESSPDSANDFHNLNFSKFDTSNKGINTANSRRPHNSSCCLLI